MSGLHTHLTLDRTLVPGAVLREGTVGPYRAITGAPGEPHLVRTELAGGSPDRRSKEPRPLLTFAHATDLQLVDVQSPARFEFCNQHVDDPRFHHLVPMHRPQEALTARAAEAMVRTLNSLHHGPRSGADIELVITTGDAIDNAQWNELRMFLALFEGGLVRPGSGDSATRVSSLCGGVTTASGGRMATGRPSPTGTSGGTGFPTCRV
ncbi:MAG: hypothetical protein WKF82_01910 [Nocardioidaceae bacterium]